MFEVGLTVKVWEIMLPVLKKKEKGRLQWEGFGKKVLSRE